MKVVEVEYGIGKVLRTVDDIYQAVMDDYSDVAETIEFMGHDTTNNLYTYRITFKEAVDE